MIAAQIVAQWRIIGLRHSSRSGRGLGKGRCIHLSHKNAGSAATASRLQSHAAISGDPCQVTIFTIHDTLRNALRQLDQRLVRRLDITGTFLRNRQPIPPNAAAIRNKMPSGRVAAPSNCRAGLASFRSMSNPGTTASPSSPATASARK